MTRGDGDLPAPKAIILPLKPDVKQAGHHELARRVVETTLQRNGINPTKAEIERMMELPVNKNLDLHGYLDKDWNFHDKPGIMPSAGKHEDHAGNKVSGYKFNLSPKFQQGVLDDYKQVRSEFAKPENANRKAVVEMNLRERINETVKIAYDKGYISAEIKKQLGNLTPEELGTAFAVGGALGIAATNAEAAAVLGPIGAGVGLAYTVKQMAEFEHIAKLSGKATNREQLDPAAKAFGEWIGQLSKDGVLALAGAAGAKVAPKVMPRVEAAITSKVGAVCDAVKQTGGLGDAVAATPEGVSVRVPKGKTPFDRTQEPLEMRGQGGYESNEVTTGGGVKMPRVQQPHEVAPSIKPNEANQPLGVADKVPTKADAELTRGITRQNEAAKTMAKNGYAVEQKPQITETDKMSNPWLNKDKKPDFKVEDEIFDAYAPSNSKSVNNIRREMELKVQKGQTRRIVLNMDDSNVNLNELRKIIWNKPIVELEQILVVKDGKVIKFFPFKN